MEYVVFHVEGGIGKNIAATVVAENVKLKYPDSKLIVVASWPDVWLHNPNIYRFYRVGNTPYFHDDFIKDRDTLVLKDDPYSNSRYFAKNMHLSQVWCEMHDVPFISTQPRIYLTTLEKEEMYIYVKNINRPFMLLQTCGGSVQNNQFPFSWFRDMPHMLAEKIVNYFHKRYVVLHLKYKEQFALNNTIDPGLSLRQIFALIPYSQKRLFIDSFAQHAAAASDTPSAVCWVGNSPKVFGYDLHTNLVTKLDLWSESNYEGYLDSFGLQGPNYACPANYDMQKLFDPNEIIHVLEKQG
jgi:hypothetical protein